MTEIHNVLGLELVHPFFWTIPKRETIEKEPALQWQPACLHTDLGKF
jgi:hypothetical protein